MLDLKSTRNTLALPCLIAALGLGTSAAASTTGEKGSQESPQLVAQANQITDKQLETFVEARARVQEIATQWEERLNNAESQEKVNNLQQAAQEEMVQAVKEEGLSVNDYNMIVSEAQADPELRQRINELAAQ